MRVGREPVPKELRVDAGAPRAGGLQDLERAWIAEKPATTTGWMSESVPPASITSASPRWIARKASPTAWLLAAQAVVGLKIGPRAPERMDTHPAAMLGRLPGSA